MTGRLIESMLPAAADHDRFMELSGPQGDTVEDHRSEASTQAAYIFLE